MALAPGVVSARRLGHDSAVGKALYMENLHFNSKGILTKAFEPPLNADELSVADVTGCDDPQKIRVCQIVVDLINPGRIAKGKKPVNLEAVAELACSSLAEAAEIPLLQGLEIFVERDDNGYDRHSHLKRYPPTSEDSKRLALMVFLASKAMPRRVVDQTLSDW